MNAPHLRIAILDYPIKLLQNKDACTLLMDSIVQKQNAFFQTSKDFVVTDKHDMIGTHFLIYDTVDLFKPKLVAAIRNTYEERAKVHSLNLPIDSYYPSLDSNTKKAVDQFRNRKGSLVDCNAWFVDPKFSHANSTLNLSEILFFTLCVFIHRLGKDHFVGATNERYKASRWVSKVGPFQENLTFTHPLVPDLHKLTLVDHFHPQWLTECWQKYGALLQQRFELLGAPQGIKSVEEVVKEFNVPKLLSAA